MSVAKLIEILCTSVRPAREHLCAAGRFGNQTTKKSGPAKGASSFAADIEMDDGAGFHYAMPRADCPHLGSVGRWTVPPTASCQVCGETECWVNVTDGQIACSRYKQAHAVKHAEETGHCVALSLSDLSFWCFKCDSYLDFYKIKELQPLYSDCHVAKFGTVPSFPETMGSGAKASGASSSSVM